tara:strand:+ start:607 stop:1782 length:1176 start_codon:yes stop_codon:yes gene_type:complete
MNVLIMTSSSPFGDPRPNRLIELLLNHNIQVDLFFKGKKSEIKNQKIFKNIYICSETINWSNSYLAKGIFTLLSAFKFYLKQNPSLPPIYYERLYPLLDKQKEQIRLSNYDYIIVEDIVLLTQATRFANISKIIFDAREYYESQSTESIKFRFLISPIRVAILNYCLPKCSEIYTVSQAIADAYKKKYKSNISVLRSIPKYRDIPVKETYKNNIRIVHHGIGYKTRGIKDMIDIGNSLDERFVLDLYLVANQNYLDEIKDYLGNSKKVNLKKPVKYDQIISMLNSYDIGLFFVKPVTFNLLNCLPNKLFEFIQGRLAVAIGPSPEMSKIVKKNNCGFVSDDFNNKSMVDLLNNLEIDDIDQAKLNSNNAAKELCFENESKFLINKILSKQY